MAKKIAATKLQPGDGAKIRRDARRMRPEKVYAKWMARGYRKQQVAAAMAWNSGALAGRANDG